MTIQPGHELHAALKEHTAQITRKLRAHKTPGQNSYRTCTIEVNPDNDDILVTNLPSSIYLFQAMLIVIDQIIQNIRTIATAEATTVKVIPLITRNEKELLNPNISYSVSSLQHECGGNISDGNISEVGSATNGLVTLCCKNCGTIGQAEIKTLRTLLPKLLIEGGSGKTGNITFSV